jgi:hypothetical protein
VRGKGKVIEDVALLIAPGMLNADRAASILNWHWQHLSRLMDTQFCLRLMCSAHIGPVMAV